MALEILAPTEFPLESDDPLAAAHRTINEYLLRFPSGAFTRGPVGIVDGKPMHVWCVENASPVLWLPRTEQLDCVRACSRFSYWSRFEWGWSSYKPETQVQGAYEFALNSLCDLILRTERDWSEEEIEEIVEIAVPYGYQKFDAITLLLERYLELHAMTDSLRPSVEAVRGWNARLHRLEHWLKLGGVLGENLVLQRGEKWADEAIAFIGGQSETAQARWRDFLLHCVHCDKTKPSAKWLNTAKAHVDEIEVETMERCFVAWSDGYGQSTATYDINQATFKGLVWSASLLPGETVAQALFQVALCASHPDMKNSPALTLNLFHACMWSLGQLDAGDANDQLLELKRRVKGSRLKSVEKALQSMAGRAQGDT